MKRFILTVLVAAISTSGVAAPRHVVKVHASAGGQEDSLGNLKRWMPKAFQNWQDNVPDDLYGESTKWLTEFDGTVTPIRAVLIGGEKRFIGTVLQAGLVREPCRGSDRSWAHRRHRPLGEDERRPVGGNYRHIQGRRDHLSGEAEGRAECDVLLKALAFQRSRLSARRIRRPAAPL